MTATSIGLVPGTNTDIAALAVSQYQDVYRDGPRDVMRERWLITDARQWPAGTPDATVVADAGKLANATGALLRYYRTGPGEVYYDLFRLDYHEERLSHRALGHILTDGQLTVRDDALPRESVVRLFQSKMSSGRIAVAPSFPLRDALREQVERFMGGFQKRGAAAAEEEPNTLLLACMFATYRKSFRSGDPDYLARNGKVYPYRSLSPDTY